MAERMGLPTTIKACNALFIYLLIRTQDRANELYKQVDDQKSMRGRTADGMTAASLYIACRYEKVPRTFKGIFCGCSEFNLMVF